MFSYVFYLSFCRRSDQCSHWWRSVIASKKISFLKNLKYNTQIHWNRWINVFFFFKTVFWFCRNIFAVFMKWNVHETYAASYLLKNKNVQSFCNFIFFKIDDFIKSFVKNSQKIQSIIEYAHEQCFLMMFYHLWNCFSIFHWFHLRNSFASSMNQGSKHL